jgi:hypothetical protein
VANRLAPQVYASAEQRRSKLGPLLLRLPYVASRDENGGSDGTRTRGLLRDRRSNQLNYAPALDSFLFPSVPSDGLAFPSVPFGRAVTGQQRRATYWISTVLTARC